MIRLKRAYAKASADDGYRVLVDRLWPRGVSKREARLDLWLEDAAPSPALRTWFGHDPKRWTSFRRKYAAELRQLDAPIAKLRDLAAAGTLTLVYGAKDPDHNHALVLKAFLERAPKPRKRAARKTTR